VALVWDILHEEALVTSRTEGTVRFDEVMAYFDALHVAGALGYRKLTDAREGSSAFPESELIAYLGAVSGLMSLTPPGPLAVVVTEESARAHYPMLRTLFAVKERSVKSFSDLDEALRWIRAQPLPEPDTRRYR
jgi:hypothetical protein